MRPSENIEKLIRKLHYETSAETHEKVLGNVLQALDEHEEQKSHPQLCFAKASSGREIWRTIMNSRTRKFAIAASILVAALIGLHYLGGSAGTAYADIVQRLQKARTLTYTSIATTPVEGMPDIEMEVAFKEPGYMRITMPGGYVSVFDCVAGKGLSIIPANKRFVEINMSNLPNDVAQRQSEGIEKLRTLPERADEDLGERTMDSRTVHGFRVKEGGMINTVWIDPQTRDLVLVEMEFVNAPGMSATMTNFQFDVDLDDSLFSLTPPDGYSRVELQLDVSEAGEQELVEFLRLWTTWTKDGTFPPTLNPVELAKVSMDMQQAGKFSDSEMSQEKQLDHARQMTRGLMFVVSLSTESNWRYAGENVKYGEAETPIFWYEPEGSQTYRIIYGDLNVRDVAPEDLPK